MHLDQRWTILTQTYFKRTLFFPSSLPSLLLPSVFFTSILLTDEPSPYGYAFGPNHLGIFPSDLYKSVEQQHKTNHSHFAV